MLRSGRNGIELLADNVGECREKPVEVFVDAVGGNRLEHGFHPLSGFNHWFTLVTTP